MLPTDKDKNGATVLEDGQPQTPQEGETPPAAPDEKDEDEFDAERAKATIKAQRESERKARADMRAAQKQLEEAQAKLKEREDAEKSELEKAQARIKDLEDKVLKSERNAQETALRYEVALQAAKLNLYDADVAFRLLDSAQVEYDAEGKPSNVAALLTALAKAHPYLVKAGASANVTPSPEADKKPVTDEDRQRRLGNRLFNAPL
jgi:hypothetical protein